MPRQFLSSSSQYLINTSTGIVSAYPFTMACWSRANDVTGGGTFQNVMSMGDNGSVNQNEIVLGFTTGGGIRATIAKGGTVGSATTTAATNGAWTHLCGVFTSATSRDAYRDGGNKASNATNLAVPVVTQFAMSFRPVTGGANYLTGAIMEAGIWNVALDADEIVALSKGVCPKLIRPTALLGYWPLFGNDSPEPDRWRDRVDLTLTNAPTKATDGIRVYYPMGVRS